MLFIFILHLINVIMIQSKFNEISRMASINFLQAKIRSHIKHEESRETIETTREFCLNDYRQQEKFYRWRSRLSSICTDYCSTTMDCQSDQEQLACINPLWPSRTIQYVQKFKHICYVRITEILRYKEAEQMCHSYGLQLAIIDNIELYERLKQLNMFNTTCKGQCPRIRGFYIGLKRLMNNTNQSISKWIWSNNVTWTQNEVDCDDYSNTSYNNSNLLCYIDKNGKKKVTVWNKHEPNNHQSSNYPSGEQCVEIMVNTDNTLPFEQIGKLNDIPCSKPTFGVICQIEDTKPINITRFETFARIIRFKQIETIDIDTLFSFQNRITLNPDTVIPMTEILDDLLHLNSFSTNQTMNILNMFDQLVNVTEKMHIKDSLVKSITNKLLQFLDLFAAKIQLGQNRSISFEYKNMNISILDIDFDNKSNEWFNININKNPNVIIEINQQALQTQLIQSNRYRIVETIFSNFNLFPQTNIANFGIPISYQIANFTMIKTDKDLIRFRIRVSESLQSNSISCVYWSFDKNNGSWVTNDGCRFAGYINHYAQCYCNHLTHFALLMITGPEQTLEPLSALEEMVLTYVTYIGLSLSIFGLVITLITYVVFRSTQRNSTHISLSMLCLSILFVNCFYIPFSLTQTSLSKLNRNIFCTILGFLFHYFFISSFMWMLIMAMVQYIHFVRILNTHISHFYIKSCIVGWLIPFIFPSLVLVLGPNGGYTGESRCWINNQILLNFTFLVPISIVILCNLILFIFILKSIFTHNSTLSTKKKNYSKVQIGATLCCFVSIGCTWLFGVIVLLDPSFNHQLIFAICNSFQGFLIFLFHVFLSKPKRALWQTFFVEHGCHSRSNVGSNQKDVMTISYSISRNVSTIKSSFNSNVSRESTFSTADKQKATYPKSSTTTNPKRNELLTVQHLSNQKIRTSETNKKSNSLD